MADSRHFARDLAGVFASGAVARAGGEGVCAGGGRPADPARGPAAQVLGSPSAGGGHLGAGARPSAAKRVRRQMCLYEVIMIWCVNQSLQPGVATATGPTPLAPESAERRWPPANPEMTSGASDWSMYSAVPKQKQALHGMAAH